MKINPRYYGYQNIILSFKEIKKNFQIKENEQRKENGRSDYITFMINEDANIWCVKPPKEFPDALLCFKFEFKNKNIDWNERDVRLINTKEELLTYEIPFVLDLNSKFYWGVISDETSEYEYLIYNPIITEATLCVEQRLEKLNDEDKRIKKEYENIEYYKIGNHYYNTKGEDPKEFAEYLMQYCVEEHTFLDEFYKPRWFEDFELAKNKIPIGVLEGKKLLFYFSPKLYFPTDIYDYISDMVTNYWRRYGFGGVKPKEDYFSSAEEFYYSFEKEFPKIRQILIVHEESLIGEPINEVSIGDKVQIIIPKEKQIALKGKQGIVSSVKKTNATVKFLNYFEEEFHVSEIKRID